MACHLHIANDAMTAPLGTAIDAGVGGWVSRDPAGSSSPSLMFLPGSVIGDRYVLERPLSTGGMGTLWIAHDRLLEIRVAIKLIRDDLLSDSVAERLLLEARLAARIEHPAIVRVLGLDTTPSGAPFIVMELLEGEDLRELLDRVFRMSPIEAVQLLLPIAGALAAAHDRKVLHRDLKPENVFIASVHGKAQPKVVDFGIAAPLDRQRRRLTRDGAVVGSPDYLSPEQALGSEDVDERADVWGFCAMLYECVTGFPPFSRSTLESLLHDVVEKPVPSLSEYGIDDLGLWPLIERGLSKQRDERWPDMRSLGVALACWLIERGVNEDFCGSSLRSEWLSAGSIPPPSSPRVDPEDSVQTLVRLRSEPPAAESVRQVYEVVRPHRRLLLAALAVVLAGACAQTGVLFKPPRARAANGIAQSIALSVEGLPARRVVAAVAPPAAVPGQAPVAEKPKPLASRARKASPRRPPDFDPVLGF